MSHLGETAVESAKGSLITFVGNTLSMFFSAGGGIFVARMLPASEYGLFGVTLIAPSFFTLLSNWGVTTALTRFTAKYDSEGDHDKVWRFVIGGFFFRFLIGLIPSTILYISSPWVAQVLLKRPEVTHLVRLISPLIISQTLYTTSLSVLAGLGLMERRSIVNFTQALVKGALSPVLVYLGFGIYGAILGYLLSYISAAVIGCILVIYSTYVNSRKPVVLESTIFRDELSTMLVYGFPLFLGGIVGGLSGRLRSILIAWFVSDENIGNFNVASRVSSLMGLISGSLGVTLFPAFSTFDYMKEPEKLEDAFKKSVRYSTMIITPMVFLLAIISDQLIYFLFTDKYSRAPIYLLLLLVPMLMVGFGSLSIGNLLNSQGETQLIFKLGLINTILSLTHYPTMIWKFGLIGLLVSGIISSVTGNVLNLYITKKKYHITIDLSHTFRTITCSIFTGGITYLFTKGLVISNPVLMGFIEAALFYSIYIVLAPTTGAINTIDIKNLNNISERISIIHPFTRILIYIERIIIKKIQ
jgi:O-antigen/teichoic acid export membrane protein